MRLAALLAVVGLVACESDATGPLLRAPLVRTDRVAYEAEYVGGSGSYASYGFTVIAQLRNDTRGTIYLGRCSQESKTPIWGVVSVDEDVRSGWGYVWACLGADPIGISPGETRTDTLRILGPNAWDGQTKEPLGVLDGAFRLSYSVAYCLSSCRDRAPDWMSVSNEFSVRLARGP